MLLSHASATCDSSMDGASVGSGEGAGVETAGGASSAAAGARSTRAGGGAATGRPRLEQLYAVGERLAREICLRACHLHEGELERQPRVGALPDVVHRDGQEVDQPEDGRLGKLVRLLAQQLPRLLGHGQRLRDVPHVLDEQEMPQVLEEIGDEAAEILAALGELVHEQQRSGRVAVDDHVAEPQERLLLDGADELEDCLRIDRVVRRRCELVERRDGVPERPTRAPSDKRQRGVGAWIPSPSATRRRRVTTSGSRGRWKTKV